MTERGRSTTRPHRACSAPMNTPAPGDRAAARRPTSRGPSHAERPDPQTRGIGSIGAVLVAGLLAAAIAGALVLLSHLTARRDQPPPEPAAWVTMIEPRGDLDSAPRRFVWNAVAKAVRYKVTITDQDAVWPLFVKQTSESSVLLADREALAIVPGRIHVWEVEALDEVGRPVAKGGVRFRVVPPEPGTGG